MIIDKLNYMRLPEVEGIEKEATLVDGRVAVLNEGRGKATLYLNARQEVGYEPEGEEMKEVTVWVGWPVRTEAPVTRAEAINSCEMEAYGLKNAMEVASFNAGLARKARANAEDEEVKEHDQFIELVKGWLDEIGIK